MTVIIHINQFARETRADRIRREHREDMQAWAIRTGAFTASTALVIVAGLNIPPLLASAFNAATSAFFNAKSVPAEVSLVLPVAARYPLSFRQ